MQYIEASCAKLMPLIAAPLFLSQHPCTQYKKIGMVDFIVNISKDIPGGRHCVSVLWSLSEPVQKPYQPYEWQTMIHTGLVPFWPLQQSRSTFERLSRASVY